MDIIYDFTDEPDEKKEEPNPEPNQEYPLNDDYFNYDSDNYDEIPFEEEEKPELVATYQQMQHTSNITGNLQQFGIFIKEEDEVVQFINNTTKYCQSIEIPFNPSEQPLLIHFINKYPHPRFINPMLSLIIVNHFYNQKNGKYEWDIIKLRKYNNSNPKPIFSKIRDYEEETKKINELKSKDAILSKKEKTKENLLEIQDLKTKLEDLLKLNELLIQQHDVVRYINLFNLYL